MLNWNQFFELICFGKQICQTCIQLQLRKYIHNTYLLLKIIDLHDQTNHYLSWNFFIKNILAQSVQIPQMTIKLDFVDQNSFLIIFHPQKIPMINYNEVLYSTFYSRKDWHITVWNNPKSPKTLQSVQNKRRSKKKKIFQIFCLTSSIHLPMFKWM